MTMLLFAVFIMVVIYMSIIFVIAQWQKRLDIVDIAWGGAFIVAALTSFAWGQPGWLQYIVTGLVLIWAIRLSTSILRRFFLSPKEDERYTDLRRRWKSRPAVHAFFKIFMVQAFLATVISLSVVVVNLSYIHTVSLVTFIGIAVWVIGFLFETIGDAQLRRYLANPKNKGKLMTSGLWRYTRHPNYFGEVMQWWGIFIIALGIPYGWLTIVAPLAVSFLLLVVSGVPLTERRLEGRSGWKEYKHQTSVFLPLPPRGK